MHRTPYLIKKSTKDLWWTFLWKNPSVDWATSSAESILCAVASCVRTYWERRI